MKWDVLVETNGQQPYSKADDLTSIEQDINPYAYCLPRYARMDGAFQNAPDVMPLNKNGYISSSLSDAEGAFREKPKITITYDRLKTSGGVYLVFNRVSGDYASQVQIIWLKDGELVHQQEFRPDGPEFFCQTRVPLFNKVEVTFLRTSRPYRYLWLAALKNQKLTDAGGLKIVYEDVALGAKEDAEANASDQACYVELDNLKEGVEFPDYALCLSRYARMDGNYTNAPSELKDMGYVSESISDQDGNFAVPPEIVFTFTQNYSSVGLTLKFNGHSGDHCSRVAIEWYRDNMLLHEQEYEPDSADFFCYGIVDYYNKVKITFLKTSKPYRNVFLTGITWGIVRIFKDDEIEDINCLVEMNSISQEVTINTMDYTLRSKSGYAFEFQKRQRQTLYFDEAVIGIFYLKDGNQLSSNRYTVETQDAIGILDSGQFMGGIYEEKRVPELLDEIMDEEGIRYFLDDAFQNITVSGYLPIGTKRNALQQLAFAIGAMVDTSYDRQLYLYPKQEDISGEFTKKDIFLGLTVEHSDIISGVRLYVHKYVKSTESSELYKGILSGSMKVEFSEPYHSLTVSGGTIEDFGDNYAYVSGDGEELLLTGKKYNHSTAAVLKENPKITQNKNIAEVRDATLVTDSNAAEVLDRVYRYYENNESIKFTAEIKDQELGDVVNVSTGFKGMRSGTITRLDFSFSRRKIIAEVTVR